MSHFENEDKIPDDSPDLFQQASLSLLRQASGGSWGADAGWDDLDFVDAGAELRDATIPEKIKVRLLVFASSLSYLFLLWHAQHLSDYAFGSSNHKLERSVRFVIRNVDVCRVVFVCVNWSMILLVSLSILFPVCSYHNVYVHSLLFFCFPIL